MPLLIIRQDITKMDVDAIVNAANKTLLGGGGVDGCIHRAAGKELLEECRRLGGCETGDAKITGAYKLPCRYVIHTVGPVWDGGDHGEKELLASCYRRSLELARQHGCGSVAFPLISSGIFGYPKKQALKVAEDTIREFLADNDMLVYITVFGRDTLDIGKELYGDIQQFIDDRYVKAQEQQDKYSRRNLKLFSRASAPMDDAAMEPPLCQATVYSEPDTEELKKRISELDESFSQMLLRKIDESGMTDVQCYKKANVDRKLFSKIRSDMWYRPSKATAIAFAIALELQKSEADELLKKAGYALSRSSKSDVIIEYFISNGIYDIFRINEALFAFDQSLLGG